jgi:SAM-dependent methyltransferase
MSCFKDTINPHLKICEHRDLIGLINNHINSLMKRLNIDRINMLDIGGGKGFGDMFYKNPKIKYYALDLNSDNRDNDITFIKGDITDAKLELPIKFDFIFSKDTFEHILNPWDATDNILKNLKQGGLFCILVPFLWRYHSSPYDTYRYTHIGLQYLFERNDKLKKIESGYIDFGKNKGFWGNKKDYTMHNNSNLPALESIYIGEKDEEYKFSLDILDNDFSWDHKT